MVHTPAHHPFIAMYVHQHWGYRHPYCARTWTLADWRGYASALSELGYTAMMIWPVLEIIPDPPTPSDRAHLEKIRDVVAMLHREFRMQVFITMGPNVIGKPEAANYAFEERPYFCCDRRLNPAAPDEMALLYRIRRQLITDYFAEADGFVVIDSDPGGWIGSTNREFVDMLRAHMAIIAEVNPNAWLYYWMWLGWETYNHFWEDVLAGKTRFRWSTIGPDCEATVGMLLEQPAESWRLLCCMNDVHKPLVRKFGVQPRTAYNPYGLIEAEPSVPMTNYTPERIVKGLREYDRKLTPVGVFANAQSHVLQIPNTVTFAHIANGGSLETLDLRAFAEDLFPGRGGLLSQAWAAMGGEDTAAMRRLAAELEADRRPVTVGKRFAGLLFGEPERSLADLVMMLHFRADLLDVTLAHRQGGEYRSKLPALVRSWRTWQARTGYADAYFGPVADLLHPVLRDLHDPAVDQALFENDDFKIAERRHGVIPRLLAALEQLTNATVR